MSQEWMTWTWFLLAVMWKHRARGRGGPSGAPNSTITQRTVATGTFPLLLSNNVCVCVCLCFCSSHMYVCLLSSVFIEIPHYLAGKQQPIKSTAICMPKPQPIYPGSLLKVRAFNMQCVWVWQWVSISCAQRQADKATVHRLQSPAIPNHSLTTVGEK